MIPQPPRARASRAAPAAAAPLELTATAQGRFTALTQDAMDVRGIKDILDVARFTPGHGALKARGARHEYKTDVFTHESFVGIDDERDFAFRPRAFALTLFTAASEPC